MSNFNPTYHATQDGVDTTFADRTALSLPDLKKDILTAYHAMTKFAGTGMTKSINSFAGRFPASARMSDPAYHTPGTRLLGLSSNEPYRNYRDIYADDRLVMHLFIDELDANARAIIDFQDVFGLEMGQAISQYNDKNAAIIIALAARASATVSGGDTGVQIEKAACDINVGALNAGIWDMKNGFDENSVPAMGRRASLFPVQYNLIASSFDRPFYRELGMNGSLGAEVAIPAYAGFERFDMSNNIPSTNIASSATGTRNTYAGDFTKTVMLAWGNDTFGTVTVRPLSQGGNAQPKPTGANTASKEQPIEIREVSIPEAFGNLILTSLVTGHGVLRPEHGGELTTP